MSKINFEGDAVTNVKQTGLESVAELLREQLRLESVVADMEEQLKGYKNHLKKLSGETIPEKMTELGMTSTTMYDGSKVEVVSDIHVSIPKEDLKRKAACYKWLEDNGLGDIIKNGRRGSINATLTIKGKQGHVAYPHLADNPMHKAFAALTALSEISWDSGNDYFDPTQLQFSNIHSGTGATNVIPGELVAVFNLRFSTEITADEIQSTCETVLDATGIDYSLDWQLSGNPFLTELKTGLF